MVTMFDLNWSSCCMRKNPSLDDQIEDSLNANIVFYAIYFGAFTTGFNMISLTSLLCLFANCFYIYSLWKKTLEPEIEPEIQDISADECDYSVDSDESDVNPTHNDDLSLKQREHGATLTKPMAEEDEIILNSRFQQLVQETKNRNNERLKNQLTRTPTGSSINDMDDTDEYDDMPALIPQENIIFPLIEHRCAACIHRYNNLIPRNTLDCQINNEIRPLNPHVPTVNEILSPSMSHMLHEMNDVD